MKAVVGFSGGVDSQATALWCRRQFGPESVILLMADTGHENPLTYAFVRDYSERVFPVVTVRPLVKDLADVGNRNPEIMRRRQAAGEEAPLTMQMLAWIKLFFPRSQVRFCTEYLKLRPQMRWCRENLMAKGISFERFIGVRAEESADRARQLPRDWDDEFQTFRNLPLHRWSKQECFDYLKAAGEEVNPLYRMGMDRVGCSPCVGQPKEQIREWAARFPEEVERVRAMERRVGKPFYAGKVEGLEGWLDEVIAWSRTAHGGRQRSLPLMELEADQGVCSSKYGLCE